MASLRGLWKAPPTAAGVPETQQRFHFKRIVRQITSGDVVSVEGKGVNPFSSVFLQQAVGEQQPVSQDVQHCCSDVSPNDSNQRVSESPVQDGFGWDKRLKEELPAFISECIATYEREVPKRGNIPLNEASKQALVEAASEFEAVETEGLSSLIIADVNGSIRSTELRARVTELFRGNRYNVGVAMAQIEKAYGPTRRRNDDKSYYYGVSFR